MRIYILLGLYINIVVALYFIFLNFSLTFTYVCYFMYLEFTLHILYVWFIFFMGIVLYFVIFQLFKRIIALRKTIYIIILLSLIYWDIVLLLIIEDLLFFIIFFELIFFPLFVISMYYSFNNRFIFAIYYLLIFTAISGILCIIIISILIFHFNATYFKLFAVLSHIDNFALLAYMYLIILFTFSIKYPIWPLHIWLPELHVEVSSETSVFLAAIILKIGFFGIMRFIFTYFNILSLWFISVLDSILVTGLFCISFGLYFMCDYKKIVAYWSILHTNIALLLLWHNDILYIGALIFCNLGHIISASFMFLLLGFFYDVYGLRVLLVLLSYFGLSIWGNLFLILFLYNIDFPLMLLFYVELFIFYGMINLSFLYVFLCFVLTFNVFLGSLYLYVLTGQYSFLWCVQYARSDVLINDIIVFVLCFFMSVTLCCIMYFYV